MLTTDTLGKDSFVIRAWGLRAKTDYTVFLIQKAGPNFGAVEYIGDFTTNGYGKAANTFRSSSRRPSPSTTRPRSATTSTRSGSGSPTRRTTTAASGKNSPVTGFDGDGSAGVQMMNSGATQLP